MINSSDFSYFRNGEFIKFIGNVIKILSSFDLKSLKIEPEVGALVKLHESIKASYAISRGSTLTKTLILLDQRRDNMFSSLKSVLEQHAQFHPDEKIRKAAASVLEVIVKHGTDLHRKPYQEQTVGTDDIISSITEEMKLTLVELGLGVYFTTLSQANQAFDQKYLERNKAYAVAGTLKLSEVREELQASYDRFTKKVLGYSIIEGEDPFKPMANEINTLIKTYEDNIARRRSKPGDQETELDEDFEDLEEDVVLTK